jgi:hypothetical protein
MFDRPGAIRVIEDALDHEPFCAVCDRPTTVREVDGVIYLSCPAATPGDGILSRLSAAILGHTDRPIADFGPAAAA